MKKRTRYNDETVVSEAIFLLENNAAYAAISNHFHIPLSTVGWHMKYRLSRIDTVLHKQVRLIVKKGRKPLNHTNNNMEA